LARTNFQAAAHLNAHGARMFGGTLSQTFARSNTPECPWRTHVWWQTITDFCTQQRTWASIACKVVKNRPGRMYSGICPLHRFAGHTRAKKTTGSW